MASGKLINTCNKTKFGVTFPAIFFLTEKSETSNNLSYGRKIRSIHYLLPDTFTGQAASHTKEIFLLANKDGKTCLRLPEQYCLLYH